MNQNTELRVILIYLIYYRITRNSVEMDNEPKYRITRNSVKMDKIKYILLN